MKTCLAAFLILLCVLVQCQALNISPHQCDFGTVVAGSTATVSFSLENNSAAGISIGIRPSCECLAAAQSRFDLLPGATATVRVTVDTTGYQGPFSKEVFVQSNDPRTPYITCVISGSITTTGATPAVHAESPSVSRPEIIDRNHPVVGIVVFYAEGCLY
jgi:hypothetical protein